MKQNLQELKQLLIVVDMVNGFVNDGKMADPYINKIVKPIKKIIEEIKNKNEGIAFIKDCHELKCNEFNRYPVHCVKGTLEAELVSELKPYEQDSLVYEKNSTATIWAPNFIADINQMKQLKQVIITGCCTDICVLNLAIPLMNYFNQIDRKVNIILPKDAVETYDAPWHPRRKYNNMAYKLLEQSGTQLVKKMEGNYYE